MRSSLYRTSQRESRAPVSAAGARTGETGRFVKALCARHGGGGVQHDRAAPFFLGPVDSLIEQGPAQAAAAISGLQVHALQLGDIAVTEEPHGDRTDDLVVLDGDPNTVVAGSWVSQVGFEDGVDI